MNERLLQFIWQFQYFNKNDLITVEGEPVQIIYQGSYNTNQGPDFLDAKIKIGNTTWAGNVELHVRSGDWLEHKHSSDKNYNNVILHVVWENDQALENTIPVIELQHRVAKVLLEHYQQLMNTGTFIACEKTIGSINEITWMAWKERLLVERLQQKSEKIFFYLEKNNNHWEETFWWLIARNFGIKINSDAFEAIAQSMPINILAKHKQQIHQLEALLFGQAGLLEKEFDEHYPKLLQKEYRFLKKKYQLKTVHQPVFFLRMRPANFPSLRLAQLAMLIHESLHLFAAVKETAVLKEIRNLLTVTANDYWNYHYVFDELSASKPKKLGNQMIDNILINTVVPVLFAYGHYHKESKYKDKALQWLMEIAEEKNTITKGFQQLGIEQKNAFDSQALIRLKNEYCDQKKCLDCAIGNKILRSSS